MVQIDQLDASSRSSRMLPKSENFLGFLGGLAVPICVYGAHCVLRGLMCANDPPCVPPLPQVLPAAAKALLLRLLLRKRTWFQLATLGYADVPQPDAAASRLSAVGLLQVSYRGLSGCC
jgi:hypothetical protein